jgi:hypothetical protein
MPTPPADDDTTNDLVILTGLFVLLAMMAMMLA